MRFKVGQEVVCTKRDEWTPGPLGPKFNEVVTVIGYNPHYPWGAVLSEYSTIYWGFHEMWFEPLADISELVEILNEETITV